ncbi:uncharacterized protein DUF3159 [Antricoccus suffuscus]|uniref:Uncharacterized protein DUF3159 n=1 Tax=Antricoccus suffuscus TaxID=1629062 RepID=A0A2T1A4Y9_9ACTN|nr:uncharacterized protein DUF3159 [Antricoccus suffuscus]
MIRHGDEQRDEAHDLDDRPADIPAEAEQGRPLRDLVIDSIGGWRGVLDSALPAAGFIIANIIAGLQPAIWTGIAIALVVFVVRLARKQSVQQAIGGLVAVAVCVFIASRTGEARGYFLFGIWRSALMAVALIGSVVIRYPVVGVVWHFLSPREGNWRSNKRLMRAYNWTTLAWGASYLLKFAVEGMLYQSHEATWLGVVRIGLGYPMTFGLLLLTFVVVRRVRGESFSIPMLRRRRTAQPDRD